MAFPESSSRHWTCKGVCPTKQSRPQQASALFKIYAIVYKSCPLLQPASASQYSANPDKIFPWKVGDFRLSNSELEVSTFQGKIVAGTSQIHKADAAKMDVENRSCVFASLSWAYGHPAVRVSAAQACELAYWTLKINTQIQCQPSPMASLAFTPYGGTLILCK